MGKNAFWQLVSIAASFAAQLIVISFFAKYFAPSEVGLIAVVSIIIITGQVFSEGGMANYVVYKKKQHNSDLFGLKLIVLCISVVFGFVIYVSSGLIESFYKVENIELLLILSCICVLIASLSSVPQALFIKSNKIMALAKIEIIQKSILILFFFFFMNFTENVFSYVYAQIASYAIRLFLCEYVSYRNKLWKFSKPNLNVFFDAKNYIFSQYLGQGCNILSSKADEIMIARILSISELGTYYLVKQFISQVGFAVNLISRRLSASKFSELQGDKILAINKYKEYYFIYSLSVFLIFFLLSVLALSFDSFIASHIQKFSSVILALLAFSWVFRVLSGNMQTGFYQFTGKPYKELCWNVIQTVIFFSIIVFFDVSNVLDFSYVLILINVFVFFVSCLFFKELFSIKNFVLIVISAAIYAGIIFFLL